MPRIVNYQLRRDTAANWTSINPVLDEGEPGWETDTGRLKLGDGSTAWTSLNYVHEYVLATNPGLEFSSDLLRVKIKTAGGITRDSDGLSLTAGTLTLFDHYADVPNDTTNETDLYSDTIAANTLSSNGDKLFAFYSLAIIGSATATTQLKIYFPVGTSRFDSGALSLAATGNWQAFVEIIRSGTTTGRISVGLQTPGAALAVYTAEVDMTGLDYTTTNVLKITGQRAGVGAASSDILAKHGYVEKRGHA